MNTTTIPFFKRKQNTTNLFSFVNCCLLNVNIIETIDELNDFMLSKHNVPSFHSGTFSMDERSKNGIPDSPERMEDPQRSKEFNVLYPKHKNSLFWCVFIAIHGYNEYLMIGNKFSNREFQEQQNIMRYIDENPHEMKSLKMKITNALLEQIKSELLVETTSNLLLLNAYSVYYKSTIYVLNKTNHTYVVFGNKTNEYSNKIIIEYSNKRYGLNDHIQPTDIDEEYLFLENFEKPLKSISNYKLDDLKQICVKFNNFNQHKYDLVIGDKKKQDLYLFLSQLCVWK